MSNRSNDGKLSQIEEFIKEYEPFREFGATDYEVPHSNIVAWLIDPKGSHGHGDAVFKRILNELRNFIGYEMGEANPEVDASDYSDLKIIRNGDDTDIMALSRSNKLAVVIDHRAFYQQMDESANNRDEALYEERRREALSRRHIRMQQVGELDGFRFLFVFIEISEKMPLNCGYYPVSKDVFKRLCRNFMPKGVLPSEPQEHRKPVNTKEMFEEFVRRTEAGESPKFEIVKTYDLQKSYMKFLNGELMTATEVIDLLKQK